MDILKPIKYLIGSNYKKTIKRIYTENIKAIEKQRSTLWFCCWFGWPKGQATQYFIPWKRLDLAGEKLLLQEGMVLNFKVALFAK